MSAKLVLIEANRRAVCLEILQALPEWFGLPHAVRDYAQAVESLPMFGAEMNGEIVGFLALKPHPPVAAEVYVLGVKKPYHRQGVGRLLVDAAAAHCRAAGVRFLTVKTLAPSRPDPFYARTRAFYDAMGFLPLEVFSTLWDANNPCLLMIRTL